MPLIVIPGEKLSTEEESMPGYGTFLEDGNVYSCLLGVKEIKDSSSYVKTDGKDIKTFSRRMMALGEVTDDLRSVMFLKIGNLEKDNVLYVALKSGKIIAKRESPGPNRHDHNAHAQHDEGKPCGVGDIVLALIVGEDKDTYALGINLPECGVVYSECSMCGNLFSYDKNENALKCENCGYIEHNKKISTLYNNFDSINRLIDSHLKIE